MEGSRDWRTKSFEDYGLSEESEIEQFEEDVRIQQQLLKNLSHPNPPARSSWRTTSFEEFFEDDEVEDDIEDKLVNADTTKELVNRIELATSGELRRPSEPSSTTAK